MIRNAIKDYLSTINPQFLERVLALSIVKNNFPEVRHVPHFVKREELWDLACDRIGNRPLTYLEFGVWEGYSIKYFAEKVGDSRAPAYPRSLRWPVRRGLRPAGPPPDLAVRGSG